MYLSFPWLTSLSKSNWNTAGSLQTYRQVSQNLKEGQVNLTVLFQTYPYLRNGGGWGSRMPLFLVGGGGGGGFCPIIIIAEPAERSEASLLRKFGNLSIRKILVVTSAYARTDSGGDPRQPDREWRMPSFLGGKSRDAFGQPRFSWREIAWPSSLLKKRFLKKLKFI